MPVVTFTTDFGTRDGYAGAMKGLVLSIAPRATLVDITHGVPAQDVAAGAVALAQAAPLFPVGSIHVAVVDPGVGGERADLLVESGGSFFVGPDNGVLSLAARAPRKIYWIEAAAFRREPVSPTFPGRGRRPRRRRTAGPQDGRSGDARASAPRRRDRGRGHPRRRVRQPHHVVARRGAGEPRGHGRGRGHRRAL